MSYDGFRPYVPVAQRREKALKEARKAQKAGTVLSPVHVEGRKIAKTVWGQAWCDNLESYSDFSNRLPRGRTYVRNGSVVDLQIGPGKVSALVSGSHLYRVNIEIQPLPTAQWKGIKTKCQGQIGSLIELLQGRLSQGVMEIVTCHGSGLFPSPKEIKLGCSCPDWAEMCKHVAAVLYGVGNRLDHQPELLFHLRRVDHLELIAAADSSTLVKKSASKKTIAKEDLAQVFGIELETPAPVKKPSGKAQPAKPLQPSPRKQVRMAKKTPAKQAPRRGK